MPQNMKSFDRFRTVSDSAVLCQLIPPPYKVILLKDRDYQVELIEKTYYYTILVEGLRTIREGVLIEEGALTEVVRYFVVLD